ncbi:MAG: ATPase, T2SS/T4P/T4SS family [Syntrophobacterales bacterium]|jgi:general secretion pathway protein A
MYLAHYNLRVKPFQLSPDPTFLWLGEQYKEALASLEYGIRTTKGLILLSGDVGTGKTTLLNATINRWNLDSVIASVSDPQMKIMDFYNFLAHSFGMERRFESKGDFLVKFSHLIFKIYKENKKLLLIIDEAQRLNHELLEEIRHLSNIETQDTKLLTIILAGQNELNSILRQNINRAVRQRISLNYYLKPLSKNDTREYIRHRLNIAGTEKKIFKADTLPAVMSFSKGYPRLINSICDHALLTGYVKGVRQIDAKIIRECAEELRLPTERVQVPSKISKWVPRIQNNNMAATRRSVMRSFAYVVSSVLLLLLFGYFFYSGGHITILNKWSETKADPPVVKLGKSKSIQAQGTEKPAATEIYETELKDSSIKQGGKAESASTYVRQPIAVADNVTADSRGGRSRPTSVVDSRRFWFQQNRKLIIYFGFNSNQLSNTALENLEQLAAALIQRPEVRIIIKGFTDQYGIYSYNKMLSESRANVVKGYLIGKSIEPSRIKTVGIGPAESIGPNKSAKFARRVEIELDTTSPER